MFYDFFYDFLEGEKVGLDPTYGVFITMNLKYENKTELPLSLKSLFRPITLVIPDKLNICEVLLMVEGFINYRKLALQFYELYGLCKLLLSKQEHYDW